ncbi:MAG: PAS domain-containing protein, partial [Methanolinea sp.]|nr:PAS domain-containing protein [Methanolinea sp.]
NGITFLKSLRESGHCIPFILFTGKGNERVAMDACNAGADYYMSKSGPAQDVFRTLREKVLKAAEGTKSGTCLEKQDAMGALILESMSDLVLVLDRQYRIVIANPAAVRAFRLDNLSLLPVQQFLTPESSARLEGALKLLMEEPKQDPRPGSAGYPILLEIGSGSDVSTRYQAVIDLLTSLSGKEAFFLVVGRRVASE